MRLLSKRGRYDDNSCTSASSPSKSKIQQRQKLWSWNNHSVTNLWKIPFCPMCNVLPRPIWIWNGVPAEAPHDSRTSTISSIYAPKFLWCHWWCSLVTWLSICSALAPEVEVQTTAAMQTDQPSNSSLMGHKNWYLPSVVWRRQKKGGEWRRWAGSLKSG